MTAAVRVCPNGPHTCFAEALRHGGKDLAVTDSRLRDQEQGTLSYCFSMSTFFATSAQRACSSFMSLANASGSVPPGSALKVARNAFMSAESSAFFTSLLSLAMTSLGVPGG